MSPIIVANGGRRYRYYISACLKKDKDKAGNLPQVPAVSIEELAANEIKNFLKAQLSNMESRLEQIEAFKTNWNNFIDTEWELLNPKIFTLIRQILVKLAVSNKGLEFMIDQENLKTTAKRLFRNIFINLM